MGVTYISDKKGRLRQERGMKGGTPNYRQKQEEKEEDYNYLRDKKGIKPDVSRWIVPLKANIPQLNKLEKEKSYIPSN